ncbi:MAG: hypothetical protein K8U03_13485 [Planctomycetia bacterium]|nr:hypothetical protein [Planctomycetia bacterium]
MSGNMSIAFCGLDFFSPLFAEKNLFQRLGDRFRFEDAQLDTGDLVAAVSIVAVGAATVWLMASYLRRSERPKAIDNPRKLFNELCQTHHLERHEWAFLRSIADEMQLETPSLLFIDPGLLDAAILDARWVEESADLCRFRETIFGEESPPAQTTEGVPAAV